MFSILLGEQSLLCWNAPINAKAIIYYRYTAICFWVIELVTFILEHSHFAKHCKAVSKATGDKGKMEEG